MSAGDPEDNVEKLMAVNQEHSGGAQDLLDPEEEYIKEKEHSNPNPPYSATGDSKIQESNVEEAEKLVKQLDLKCEGEISTNEDRVTKDYAEDYEKEKDKNELQSNSGTGTGCNLPNYPSTHALSEIAKTEVDTTGLPLKVTMDELLTENRKNPLLLRAIIRHVLKFLNIEDLKNARLVCQEWSSTGKLALGSCALIHLYKFDLDTPSRLPEDFQSCFLDSVADFSAFKITGYLSKEPDIESYSWTIDELTKFFDKQQKYIKELILNLDYPEDESVKNTDITPWISKSPMLQKDAKHLTKLSIEGEENNLAIPPFHLILHIQDLTLMECNITLEAGIKICPTKFKLKAATFFEDGIKLDRVTVNDFVDLDKAKEVSLDCLYFEEGTQYVVDLWGKVTLDKLILKGIEILNGEKSQWVIKNLVAIAIPYSLNSQMHIKELFLSHRGTLDLFTLPTSLQKLALVGVNNQIKLRCSQPIKLENLQYLCISLSERHETNFSFLSHFKDCPQLTFLKFYQCGDGEDINFNLIPRSVKTLTLEYCLMAWDGEDDDDFRKLEKLVVDGFRNAEELCETNFQVDNFIVDCKHIWKMGESFVDFLEHRKRFNFGNRLYIGNLNLDKTEIEESVLLEHVDAKSSCYVFENWEKGRSISQKAFLELLPQHINMREYPINWGQI